MSFNSTFDKELELRDVADGAETATAAEQAFALDADRFNRPFVAVVNVTALDRTTGDETYVMSIEADFCNEDAYRSILHVNMFR